MVLGITGLPGSGKSSFSKCFGDYGVLVIDADRVGHRVLAQDPVVVALVEHFGKDILIDGQINRGRLAQKAFQPHEIAHLNAICHPAIYREIEMLIKTKSSLMSYIVLEAALLFEAGFSSLCDFSVCLNVPFESRVERVSQRGWSRQELKNRDEHQDATQKQTRSDLCLNGDVPEGHLKLWTKKLDIILRYAMAVGEPHQVGQLLKSWKYPLLLA